MKRICKAFLLATIQAEESRNVRIARQYLSGGVDFTFSTLNKQRTDVTLLQPSSYQFCHRFRGILIENAEIHLHLSVIRRESRLKKGWKGRQEKVGKMVDGEDRNLQPLHITASRPVIPQKEVVRPGFWRLSTTICAMLANFGTSILIARTIGPSGFGIYMLVCWLATVSLPAVGVGVSPLTNRHITETQSHESPRLVAGIFYLVWHRQYRNIVSYGLVYILLAFLCSRLLFHTIPLVPLLVAGLIAPPMLLSGVASATLRSLKRFDILAVLHLFGAFINLFMVILAIQIQFEQISILLLASATASILTLIVALISVIRLLPLEKALTPGPFLQERLKRGLYSSFRLFLQDVVVWQHVEVLIVVYLYSTAKVGNYLLATSISLQVMELAPLLLSVVILPLILHFLPGQRYKNIRDAFYKTTLYLTLITLTICLVIAFLAPWLIENAFGADFKDAILPFRILLVAAAFGSISTISLTLLVRQESKRIQARLGTIAALLALVLAIPLVYYWGIMGAAIASASAQIFAATSSMALCYRYLHS